MMIESTASLGICGGAAMRPRFLFRAFSLATFAREVPGLVAYSRSCSPVFDSPFYESRSPIHSLSKRALNDHRFSFDRRRFFPTFGVPRLEDFFFSLTFLFCLACGLRTFWSFDFF